MATTLMAGCGVKGGAPSGMTLLGPGPVGASPPARTAAGQVPSQSLLPLGC